MAKSNVSVRARRALSVANCASDCRMPRVSWLGNEDEFFKPGKHEDSWTRSPRTEDSPHGMTGGCSTSGSSSTARSAGMANGDKRQDKPETGSLGLPIDAGHRRTRCAQPLRPPCDGRRELGQLDKPPSQGSRKSSFRSSTHLPASTPQRTSSSSVESINSKGSIKGAGYCLRMYDWQPSVTIPSKRRSKTSSVPPQSKASWCCMQ